MRYLGIDYGKKRIGVAVSDPGGRIAFPRKTITNRGVPKTIEELKKLLEAEKISEIIVGIPIGLDGKDSETTREVREFAEKLSGAVTLPIRLENEMLTTHMVESEGVKKGHTDEAAAALILQSYLDKINR